MKNMRGNSLLLKQYKNNLSPLTGIQKVILIGLALGDMYIRKPAKAKHALLRFEYGIKNEEYGHHIYGLFKDYFLLPPVVYTRENSNGNTVKTLRFHSISHEAFDFLVE